MAEKLAAMVDVEDLEVLLKMAIKHSNTLFENQKNSMAFYRLCAAIAIAKDQEKLPKGNKQEGQLHASEVWLSAPMAGYPTAYEGSSPFKFKIGWNEGKAGSKVNAIKLLREFFPWGLLEAKKAIENGTVLEIDAEKAKDVVEMAKKMSGVFIVPIGPVELPST